MTKKVYLGIVSDESESMGGLSYVAKKDYNDIIESYKKEQDETIEVYVSSLSFSTTVKDFKEFATPIDKVKPLTSYTTGGLTALRDGIGEMIDHFSAIPANDDVQFILMIQTDGAENASVLWSDSELKTQVQKVQAKGNWTITLRAPDNHESRYFSRVIGIPENNVYYWDGVSEKSYVTSSNATTLGVTEYMSAAKLGTRSVSAFYTDLSNVSSVDVASKMKDISVDVKIFTSTCDEVIQPFVEKMTGQFVKGTAYYQLTKTEKEVQDYKILLIRDKTTGSVYAGRDARTLLNLPQFGSCKIIPGNHGNFDLFIQSTSINRKLPKGTMLAVWDSMSLTKINPPQPTVYHPSATYKAPVKPSLSFYDMGFKDGKSHKKQQFKDNKDYMKGYRNGRG